MPQGDLVFFPYDVTVVLAAYLAGYTIFVSLFAPRLVLIFRARNRVNNTAIEAKKTSSAALTTAGNSFNSLQLLSAGSVYAVGTSEFLLQVVQFVLLLAFLYVLARNQLQQSQFKIVKNTTQTLSVPTFGAVTTVANNLLVVWNQHRTNLYYQPAVHALHDATHYVLYLLQRGTTPAVLPRLLSVVRASKGLNAV